MPVLGNKLQRFVIKNCEAVLQRHYKNNGKSNHAPEQMNSVKTAENVEEAALLGGRQINTGINELFPGGQLAGQENEAKKTANAEPPLHALAVVPPDRPAGQFDCQATHQQNSGVRPE